MGNRVIVVFINRDRTEFSPSIYLHWNGGPESIYAFLKEMDIREVRGSDHMEYQAAGFIKIVGDLFGPDGLSLGVSNLRGVSHLNYQEKLTDSNYMEDNGLYLIDRTTKKIKMHRFINKGWLGIDEITQEKTKALKYKKAKGLIDHFDKVRDFFKSLDIE